MRLDHDAAWVIAEHPSNHSDAWNCPGTHQPVSSAAYASAVAAYAATSVHAGESTFHLNPSGNSAGEDDRYTDTEEQWRHGGWAPVRRRVIEALATANVPQRRRDAFATCGHNAWVMVSTEEPKRYRVASSNCNDRFCTPCALTRASIIRRNLAAILQQRRSEAISPQTITHRFLTLTVKTTPSEPLRGTLDNLAKWFKRLRSSKIWRKCVRGGAAVLELKYNDPPGRWHPHLHIVIEGNYIPHEELKQTWHEITKTSYVCHVTALRNDEHTIGYITKYASKPLDHTFCHEPDLVVEAIEALAGRKLIATFGTWYKYALLKREPSGDWQTVMTLDTLVLRARGGDRDAQAILDQLQRSGTPRIDTSEQPEALFPP